MITNKSGRSRKAITLGLVAALVASASACTALGRGEDVHTAKVKALWFSGELDSVKEGIAEVEISVGINDKPTAFNLDLDTERAQGAGASWTAATWSAASVATLFSFRDPRTVDITASVDGPINGPSAGGLMASTMLALSAGAEINPDTTMTGTINPDGSIGLVGGIPAKLQAAKVAGLKKVLIPKGPAVSEDPRTGKQVNLQAEAKRLGLEVTEVSSIFEAMPLLTGRADLLGDLGDTDPISKPVLASISKSASELDELIQRQQVRARKLNLPNEEIAELERGRSLGVAALKAKQPVDAYAQLWHSYYQGNSVLSEAEVEAAVKRDGVDAVRQQLLKRIDALEATSKQRSNQAAQAKMTNIEQMVGLTDALTWVGSPEISVGLYRDYLNQPDRDERDLVLVAEALAESTANVEVSLDQSLAGLTASAGIPANQEEVSNTLASYTDFLKQTGDASLNYFEEAVANLSSDQAKAEQKLRNFDYSFADSMRNSLRESSSVSGLAEQRKQLFVAVSYYIATAQLAVESDILQAQQLDPLDRNTVMTNRTGFDDALAASTHVNNRLLRLLAEDSIDSSYAHWLADWGRWQATQSGRKYPDGYRLWGLTNTWQASIQLLLLNSDPMDALEHKVKS